MPKATNTLPSADYLHQCFEYDATNGVLRWRGRPRGHFRSLQTFGMWNTRFAGHIAGRPTPKGYLQTCLDGRRWYVARIIYKMHHGIDPEWIDHKDRNRSNNMLSNLRSANMRENNRNMVKRAGKTGHIGIRFLKRTSGEKPFKAVIRDENGKKRSLGSFNTAEEAHAAYQQAANNIFGEFSPFND